MEYFGIHTDDNISIHAPAWGATFPPAYPCPSKQFQSTHPRGVRQFPPGVCIRPQIFQSTHPRGVRPTRLAIISCWARISIHAPAWGSTVGGLGCTVRLLISIHAPAWGATQRAAIMAQVLKQFQSTHPRGVRPPTCTMLVGDRDFNPRTRVGCDLNSLYLASSSRFQSTHPRGVRP